VGLSPRTPNAQKTGGVVHLSLFPNKGKSEGVKRLKNKKRTRTRPRDTKKIRMLENQPRHPRKTVGRGKELVTEGKKNNSGTEGQKGISSETENF